MSSPYPVLDNKPIDQWRVTELKDELKRRKLTTRGLKDDLIRRLDEAMCAEMDSNAEDSVCNESELNKNEASHTAENINSVGEAVHNEYSAKEVANGFDSNLEPQGMSKDLIAKSNKSQMVEDIEKQVLEVNEDATKMDIDGSLNNVSTKMEVVEDVMVDGSVKIQEVDKNAEKVETVGSVEIQDGESTVTSDSISLVGQAVEHSVSVETKTITTEAFIVKIASSGHDFQNTEIIVENENQKLPHDDAVLNVSNPDNQVSEVCPALGFQVNSESISTDSVSINEKNELKDNLNGDNSLLELEVVKPEMVQPSSSDVPFEGGNMLHENQNAAGETCDNDTTNVNFNQKNYSAEGESSEKLNLDRSSGDDSMEDILESKLSDLKNDNDAEAGDKNEVLSVKEEMSVDGMEVGSSLRKNDNLENSTPAEKRKLEDKHVAVNNEPVKRQRQWNTESVKIPEVQTSTITASTTPKDAVCTVPKRNFTRSDSTLNGGDTPKERVVPPPLRSPTNSLRINNFLRPFTLKAVQELLAKTGTVSIFWMDHIKTHCYVTYSSVEEAAETRNALYNLQWPVNGGKLLAAEFVEPEEVKQAEASHSLASPVGVSSSIKPSAPAPFQPSLRHQDLKSSRQQEFKPSPRQQDLKPSPRQQDLGQKLPLPPKLPPPPPPPLSDPPAAREQIQLPPPPLLKKPDPPIVTLDDLFKKTRATPRIYYLPLSEEQVAAKLLGREKNVK